MAQPTARLSWPTPEQFAALVARVERLEARAGPRDEADAHLLAVLARAIGARRFTSRALVAHARLDAEVRDALDAADLTGPREVGCYLRRMAGVRVDGREIRRVGTGRRRAVAEWFVYVENTAANAGRMGA